MVRNCANGFHGDALRAGLVIEIQRTEWFTPGPGSGSGDIRLTICQDDGLRAGLRLKSFGRHSDFPRTSNRRLQNEHALR